MTGGWVYELRGPDGNPVLEVTVRDDAPPDVIRKVERDQMDAAHMSLAAAAMNRAVFFWWSSGGANDGVAHYVYDPGGA